MAGDGLNMGSNTTRLTAPEFLTSSPTMVMMLEIYRGFVGHHDFLIRIEDSVIAEILENAKKKCFVAC
jgi:hypothetical protein